MKLIIRRGATQIGGTCVEVETQGTRILIDFGMELMDSSGTDFSSDNYLEGKSVPESLARRGLFDIKGLYRNSAPYLDSVLISHSHKDHYGLLPLIAPEIPIYISKGAYEFVRTFNAFLPASKRTTIAKPIFLRHRRPVKIGGLEITPYLVDHSGFDGMGFVVREITTGKTLLYTGDFRATGWTRKRYEDFISNPPKRVDCLLMEGTMLGREGGKYPDEPAVVQGVIEAIQKSANTVIPVYCSGQNIDRIVSLYKAARKTGALLVVDPYTACMLKVAGHVSSRIPQIEWQNVRVFIANYGRGDIYINKISKSDLKGYISSIGRRKIKLSDFSRLKQKALLIMRSTMIPVVKKIPEVQGSTLIYSLWEGYIKDKKKAAAFWDFVRSADLKIEYIHTSGHATVERLQEFAAKIKARQIVPIHTAHPEDFEKYFGGTVVCHKDWKPFEV